MNKNLRDKENLVIFFYDSSIRELRETQGDCIYLRELLTNYENEYGKLNKDCFIIGKFDTIYSIREGITTHCIKNPVILDLDLDLDFDFSSMIEENHCLRFADSRQVHYLNLLEVLDDTLIFYIDPSYEEMQYYGIKEYLSQKHSNLNCEDECKMIQIMQDEIWNSILSKDLQELRKQNEALKKYEKYELAMYKVIGLEKDQRKLYDLEDELEIEFKDTTKMQRTLKWIIKNHRVVNAEMVVENNKVLLIGTTYLEEAW